jgi:Ni/Co efflux regulator RcnB
MKRLLLSATAIVIMAAPAISTAGPNQGQAPDYRSAPSRAQPAPSQPAYRAPAYEGGQHYSAPAPRFSPPQAQPQHFGGPAGGYAPRPAPQGWADGARGHYPPAGPASGQYRGPYGGGYQGGRPASQPYRTADRGPSGYDRDHDHDRDFHGYRDGDEGRGRAWWNGRRGFEGYEGRRDGYWYAPGRGYYRPGPYAYGYGWSVGAYVPFALQSYYVEDPYDYGVEPAPYGYRWIFLDDELVLIDLRTGLIVETADAY